MKTKDITVIALFSALIAIGAFISIPIGPVPFTLQNFFVFMAGLLLIPSHAFLAVLIYVLLGLVGLPIFAGFKGGFSYIFSPTFGFLISFIIGAYFISKYAHKTDDRKKIFMVLIIAEIIFYAIGLPYFYMIMKFVLKTPLTFVQVIQKGMLFFLIPDFIKLLIAGIIAPRIRKSIKY